MKLQLSTYSEAINQALDQSMKIDKDVKVFGQLVDYKPESLEQLQGLLKSMAKKESKTFSCRKFNDFYVNWNGM